MEIRYEYNNESFVETVNFGEEVNKFLEAHYLGVIRLVDVDGYKGVVVSGKHHGIDRFYLTNENNFLNDAIERTADGFVIESIVKFEDSYGYKAD